jgi:hypothetical protein
MKRIISSRHHLIEASSCADFMKGSPGPYDTLALRFQKSHCGSAII